MTDDKTPRTEAGRALLRKPWIDVGKDGDLAERIVAIENEAAETVDGSSTGRLRAALQEALEVIDLQAQAADGDVSAAVDIRLRPSVMRTWRKKVAALAAAVETPTAEDKR